MEGASFQPGNPKTNGLSILYYNARSLLPKVDELAATAKVLQPTIICVVETWLSDQVTDPEISIEGYITHRLDRNRHGGGVIVYIDSCVSAELLMVGPSNLEFLSISVTSPYSTHKHCISVFYRPPSSSPAIFDNVFTVIQQLNLSSFSSFVLIGDFNIDFYNSSHPLFLN